MQSFDVASFWPFWSSSKIARFDYKAIDGSLAPITSVFSYDKATQSMLYDDYNADSVWQDRWFYKHQVGFGVAEWRDDYPANGVVKTLFGDKKKLVFSTPIGWGDKVQIGDYVANTAVVDTLKSCPPQFGSCVQSIVFEAFLPSFQSGGVIYPDVLVFMYQQKWGSKITGARYWMARGIGPISVQWHGVGPNGQIIESSRLDAALTIY